MNVIQECQENKQEDHEKTLLLQSLQSDLQTPFKKIRGRLLLTARNETVYYCF